MGKVVGACIHTGELHVLSTILDAQSTTLLAGVISKQAPMRCHGHSLRSPLLIYDQGIAVVSPVDAIATIGHVLSYLRLPPS